MSKHNHSHRPTKPYIADVRLAEPKNDSADNEKNSLPETPIVVEDAFEEDECDEEYEEDCDENEDAGEKISYLHKIGSFFYGCYDKTLTSSKSAMSNTWSVLCKIPSYCVLRLKPEDEEEVDTKVEPADGSQQTAVLPTPETKRQTVTAIDEYDEDEDEYTPSRWRGLAIKTAALAASVLVIVGGYFAAMPMLQTFLNQTPTEMIAEQTNDEDGLDEIMLANNTEVPQYDTFAALETGNAFPPPAEPLPFDNLAQMNESNVQPTLSPVPVAELQSELQSGWNETAPSLAPLGDFTNVDSLATQPTPALQDSPFGSLDDPFAASIAAALPDELPALSTLAELAGELETAAFPQLEPLTPSDAPVLDMPALANAVPELPTASEFSVYETKSAGPTPPAVAMIPAMPIQPTIPIIENVKEIIPVIPSAGIIEEVPPPPVPVVAESAPAFPVYPDEFAPAIPNDASALAALEALETVAEGPQIADGRQQMLEGSQQMTVESAMPQLEPIVMPHSLSLSLSQSEPLPEGSVTTVQPPSLISESDSVSDIAHINEPVPAIPSDASALAALEALYLADSRPQPVVELTEPPQPRILPAGSQPMDWELWERIRELRDEAEPKPSNLRFDNTTASSPTTEPALRFEPKGVTLSNASPINTEINEVGQLLNEAMQEFSGLAPPVEAVVAIPEQRVAMLSDTARVPPPVFGDPLPAYRNDTAADLPARERGVTFQRQIDSEISRSPSETQNYVIQQGDTYMKISDQFYGTSLLYSALAAHNQKLGVGWRPAEGVSIEVPPAEYLRQNYGEVAQRRQMNTPQAAVRYVVQEGDTVFRLATDKLRDSSRWREIYALNADRIQDVRNLTPGMEILLPAETARR